MTKRQYESREEARERQRARINGEGVDAAIEALIGVCRDRNAAAPAKSSAGTALIRAAGFFEKREDFEDKEIHEMTMPELRAYQAQLARRGDQLDRDIQAQAAAVAAGEYTDDAGGEVADDEDVGQGAGVFS